VITVKLHGPLRHAARAVELELEAPAPARDVLEALCRRHPALRGSLFDAEGRLPDHLVALLDGRNLHSLRGLDTPVPDGATLALVHPIEGG